MDASAATLALSRKLGIRDVTVDTALDVFALAAHVAIDLGWSPEQAQDALHEVMEEVRKEEWEHEYDAVASTLLWNGSGKHKVASALVMCLLPAGGPCTHPALETLRVYAAMYNDMYKNGHIFMRDNALREQLLRDGVADFQGLRAAAADPYSLRLLTPTTMERALDEAVVATFAAAWPHLDPCALTEWDDWYGGLLPQAAVCENKGIANVVIETPPAAKTRASKRSRVKA